MEGGSHALFDPASALAAVRADVTPPSAPGLGIQVDEALARAHPFTGSGLHLEMQEAPCNYSEGNAFLGGAPASEG